MNEQSIFIGAMRLSGNALEEFLADQCKGDAALRKRIESLLAMQEKAGGFLSAPAVELERTRVDVDATLSADSQLGPYRLLEPIGEGGMGTVYMAEQREPVKRRVAVKLIKPGMDSKQVIARFDAERQALAIMDHPNIAKIHDAGTTDGGRPYFVMELVKGLPITEFCDKQKLSMSDRLELFCAVCNAVQHAHQKGVIHRDLKPSNIMIAMYDDRPVPKVIDFGVAKATNESIGDATYFTRFGQVVGTLTYMSPEQAQFNQLDIDTRSDVYSLGAILYELIVGEPPFDKERVKSQAFDETLRMIREEEPTKPSTKLSSIANAAGTAADRNTTPEKLGLLLRGDLDWIVMKALEKDRARRYESSSALADDVQRFLKDELVEACPPTVGYRLRKMIRRNKSFFTAATLVFVSLIAGTSIASWQFYVASAERNQAQQANKRAEEEAAVANAIVEFLQVKLLGKANPTETPDPNIKLITILERAEQGIEGEFAGQPLVEAAIRNTISQTYHQLGKYKVAWNHQKRAIELVESTLGPNAPKTLSYKSHMGRVVLSLGKINEARELLAETYELQKRILGKTDAETLLTLHRLAKVLSDLGKFDEAEEAFEQVVAARELTLGKANKDTIWSNACLGANHSVQGNYSQAANIFGAALKTAKEHLGSESPLSLKIRRMIASLNGELGHLEEAEAELIQLRETFERTHGVHHPLALICDSDLATIWASQGLRKKAKEARLELLNTYETNFGDEFPGTLNCMENLSTSYENELQFEKAIDLYSKALQIRKRIHGLEHPETLQNSISLAESLIKMNELTQAETLIREALAAFDRTLGSAHPQTIRAMGRLARLYIAQERNDQAEEQLRAALEVAKRELGNDHRICISFEIDLAASLAYQGRVDKSEAQLTQTLATCERVQGEGSPDSLVCMANLGRVHFQAGNFLGAERMFRRYLEICKRDFGERDIRTIQGMNELVVSLNAQERYEDALEMQHASYKLGLEYYGKDHAVTNRSRKQGTILFSFLSWMHANTADLQKRDPIRAIEYAKKCLELEDSPNAHFNLGVALFRNGEFKSALQVLNSANEMSEDKDRIHRPFLAMTHWKMGNREEALRYYQEYIDWFLANEPDDEQHRFRKELELMMDQSSEGVDSK